MMGRFVETIDPTKFLSTWCRAYKAFGRMPICYSKQ